MSSKVRWRAWLEDQQGISLIEILAAVTIISIISVTMMGYLIAGLNKSADESRRIIAANLARLKAAEIKESLKTSTDYGRFALALKPGLNTFNKDTELPVEYRNQQPLEVDIINGSTYRFILSIRKDPGVRSGQLAAMMSPSSPDDYLLDMSITVYWDNSAGSIPHPAKSTTIDTYLVRSR
jgi:prepilin-type N-terminal cleavage/methylation domain-containing protein